MNSAVAGRVRFNAGWDEGTGLPGQGTFSGLDEADRQILYTWLACADERCIDAVIDLTTREWNLGVVPIVFGVFETGRDVASWLLAGYGGVWVLARISDSFISDVTDMGGVLALIEADLLGG